MSVFSKILSRFRKREELVAPSFVASEPAITFIITYYNQQEVLAEQLALWASYPKGIRERLHIAIIDDGSVKPALPVVEHVKPALDVSVYRILEDKYCNIGGARNLGTKLAPTEWVLHTDVDIVIPAVAVAQMLSIVDREESDRSIYKFNRRFPNGREKIHPGTMLLTRDAYWKVGGCDEDFVGNYGQTDIHFFYRADKIIPTDIRTEIMLEFREDGETPTIDRSKLEPNRLLLEEKKRTGNWSDEFLRFEWEREM